MPRKKTVPTVPAIQEQDTLPSPMPGEDDVSTELQLVAVIPEQKGVTLKYSAEDMLKLDQFAIGLVGDTTRSIPGDGILESRMRAAYLRAEVMLTIRKEIAALEA